MMFFLLISENCFFLYDIFFSHIFVFLISAQLGKIKESIYLKKKLIKRYNYNIIIVGVKFLKISWGTPSPHKSSSVFYVYFSAFMKFLKTYYSTYSLIF
jgi:hypothetical protein